MVTANNLFTTAGFNDPYFNKRATGSLCHELGHSKT